MDIAALTQKYEQSIIELRRHFHRYPETSGREHATQRRIIEELQRLGLEPRPAAGTGVVVDLPGKGGRTVALRADIDALPICEEGDKVYKSLHDGVCHACGHDGHIAMALGVAMVLSAAKDSLGGTVRLIFQPSEELFPGGALAMIEDGALAGVEAIVGAHLWQPLEVGEVGVSYGPLMAGAAKYAIAIQGRGGHSSMQHQAVNPIQVGTQVVNALNTVAATAVKPSEPLSFAVTVFHGGEAPNVIPDTARIEGTLRSFDHKVDQAVFARMETLVQGICHTYGATCAIDTAYGYPPVVNDKAVTRTVARAAAAAVGEAQVREIEPVFAAEDFANYLGKVPGTYIFIGAGNAAGGVVHPHHHPRFDLDERSLAIGVRVLSTAMVRLANGDK